MATVQNAGDPGRGIDYTIPDKSSMMRAFRGNGLPALKIVTGVASVTLALNRNLRGDDCARVYNPGATAIRIKFGSDSDDVATLSNRAIAPGSVEIFNIGPGVNYIAAIGTEVGALEVDCGRGL